MKKPSKLNEKGNVKAGQACPFKTVCMFTDIVGSNTVCRREFSTNNEFSCGIARAFDILEKNGDDLEKLGDMDTSKDL